MCMCNIMQICSEFNPVLRKAFSQTPFFNSLVDKGDVAQDDIDSFDGPPEKIGNWTSPPTCIFGIPGITRSVTILGKEEGVGHTCSKFLQLLFTYSIILAQHKAAELSVMPATCMCVF